MKLTKNALGMLLNEYRAVLKNAYLKGLASAVVLTVGLSTAANAEAISVGESAENPLSVEVSGEDSYENDALGYINDLTVSGEGASLTVNSTANSGDLFANGKISVTDGAALNIEKGNIHGYIGKTENSKDIEIKNGAQVKLTGGSFDGGIGNVYLDNASLTVDAEKPVNNVNGAIAANINFSTSAEDNVSEGEFFVTGEKSKIAIGIGLLNAHNYHLSDGTISLQGSDQGASIIRANHHGSFNLQGADMNVSGKNNYLVSTDINLNSKNSELTVNEDSKLQIGGYAANSANLSAITNEGSFKMTDGTFTNKGEVNFKSTDITVSGGTINNAENAEMVLGSDAQKTSFLANGGSINNSGTLTFNANANINGASVNNTGTMNFKSGTTSSMSAAALGVLGEGQGKVSVENGATLKLTDSEITFSENDFADNSHQEESNNIYGAGNILNAGVIDASDAKVTITSDNNKEYSGGSKQSNVLFMAKGELIAGALDVEQKTFGDNEIEDFTVLGGTLSVKGDITGDNGDIKIFAISGKYASDEINTFNGVMNLSNVRTVANRISGIHGFRVFGSPDASDDNKQDIQAKLNVTGAWDFGGAGVKVNNYGTASFENANVANLGKLHMTTEGSSVNITNSTIVSDSLQLDDGVKADALTASNSNLTVNGNVSANVEGSINLTQNSSLTLDYAKANAEKGDEDTDITDDGLGDGVLKTDSTSSLILAGYTNQDGGNSLTLKELQEIKKSFVGENFAGKFSLEGVKVTDAKDESGNASFNDAQNASGLEGVYSDATVTGVTGDVSGNHDWGNAQLADNQDNLSLDSNATIELNGSGNLVKDNNGDIKGVKLADNSTLGLNGTNAELGAIVASSNGNGTVQTAGDVTIASIGVLGTSVNKVDVLDGSKITLAGDVYTNTLDVQGTVDMGGNNLNVSTADISGTLANVNEVNAGDSVNITGDLSASSFKFTGTDKSLTVGSDNASASVNINAIDLNGGSLSFDPDYTQKAGFSGIGVDTAVNDVFNANGDVNIQRNNIIGIGLAADDAYARTSRYVNFDKADGSLLEDEIGAVMYQDAHYQIANGNGLVVTAAQNTASANNFTLEQNTAWILSSDLVSDCTYTDDANPAQAAIIFTGTNNATDLNASVTLASGSKIIFDGAQVLGNDRVKLFGATDLGTSTSSKITISDQGTEIIASSGLLQGVLDAVKGDVSFKLSQNADQYLSAQSYPVREMTKDVVGNESGKYDLSDSGVSYIAAVGAQKGGADIEETARLAVLGGAVQTTMLAQSTSTHAVEDRLSNANPNSGLIFSDNKAGSGIWMMPVYRNQDSDKFNNQGVNGGADIDLYGAALGADFTTNSGIRFGGYFNVGNADVDGQGVGSDISNDADYFGFGLYAGMSFGNFGLIADTGFTKVSNDLSQNSVLGSVTADTDTTAYSIGLRGEYLFKTSSLDVTPHLGVRFTNLDMDSYDAKLNGNVIASTGSNSMQVVSVPFGVTLAKDFTAGNWTVQPMFDVTLTANTGDTDFDFGTTFVGADRLCLSSEVLDDFTYGATMGVAAKYNDSLRIGVSVDYVGSDNTDSLGVVGNVRYAF